jgi:hypothetical protein
MADIADITDDRAALEAPYLIAASRRKAGPAETGHCAYCNATLPPGLRFCDSSCRDDFEAEERTRERQGLLR